MASIWPRAGSASLFPAGLATVRGSDGLYGRADLAGLNLAAYPSILVEMGNMKHPGDAEMLTSAQGQSAYATAVVRGIAAYLSAI